MHARMSIRFCIFLECLYDPMIPLPLQRSCCWTLGRYPKANRGLSVSGHSIGTSGADPEKDCRVVLRARGTKADPRLLPNEHVFVHTEYWTSILSASGQDTCHLGILYGL